MRVIAISMFALLSAVLTGCGGISNLVRDEQTIPIAKDVNQMKDALDLGSLYAWPPHASAMVIDGKGNRCVRVAAGARVTGGASQTGVDLNAFKKVIEGASVNTQEAVQQAFMRLNTPSELANILDLVLFHHCIQDSNGTFNDGPQSWKARETMDLYKSALDVVKAAYSSGALKPAASGEHDKNTVSAGKTELQPKDTKPKDTKPEDTKPEDTKPEDTKPEETPK